MKKHSFAWLAVNEDTDAEGFYLQGEAAWESEKRELTKLGAPDVEELEFVSIEPEDRDEAMVEALVTERFAFWAKTNSETGEPFADNGDSNLVYYDK